MRLVPRHPWSALAEIFDAAARLPPAEQAPFLDAACAGDTALRASVERLLDADTRVRSASPSFLSSDADVFATIVEALARTRGPTDRPAR